MKKQEPYLITVTMVDGEHEHRHHAVIRAANQQEAEERATASVTLDASEMDTEDSPWAFGDGMTATKLEHVLKLSEAEASSLHTLGIAYEMDSETQI